MFNSYINNLNSCGSLRDSLVFSTGIGYLSTWSVTFINPSIGGLYSLNQAILHEIFYPIFHHKNESDLSELIGMITEIAGSIGITGGICKALSIPIRAKELVIVAVACTVVPFMIGITIGILKKIACIIRSTIPNSAK